MLGLSGLENLFKCLITYSREAFVNDHKNILLDRSIRSNRYNNNLQNSNIVTIEVIYNPIEIGLRRLQLSYYILFIIHEE